MKFEGRECKFRSSDLASLTGMGRFHFLCGLMDTVSATTESEREVAPNM